MAHRLLTVLPHLAGTIPWVELPSGRGCLPLIMVHDIQGDATECCFRSLGRYGIPCMSSVYASWGYVVVGLVTPGACACAHPPPGHRLQRLYEPSLVRRGQRRPRLQCPRFSYALFASAMPPPDHVPAQTCERHVGERVGGDARLGHCTARQYARSRRWRQASVADDSHVSAQASLSGGVPELGEARSPRQVPVALRRHRAVARGGGCSERRHAFARHLIPRCAFCALSCLRDRGAQWRYTRKRSQGYRTGTNLAQMGRKADHRLPRI
jgi:hypothetical protein